MTSSISTQELINELQERVAKLYEQKGYTADVNTLFIGLVEEVGELAEIMILNQADYIPTKKKANKKHDTVAHEIGDILIYALSLCNKLGVKAEWHGAFD